MINGWTIPVQPASFKGVRFEVLEVADSLARDVAEHTYPFKNGADLEDMGLQPHCVDVQAIFFGADYQRRFKKLLSVLHQKGAGVFVHPILGRMPNMICVSASFRHEADYINYVAVDLSFKEATEAEPIFVFESPLVTKIDDLINQLEDFLNAGTDFWQKVMANVSIAQHWKARLLGIWGGLYGTFYAIRRLFDLDKKKYVMSSSVSQHHYAQQGVQALGQISEMVSIGIDKATQRETLTFQAKLRNVIEAVENARATVQQVANDESLNRSKTVKIRPDDVKELAFMLDVVTFHKFTEFATLLIEEEQDTLIAYELTALNQEVRLRALNLIQTLRAIQYADQQRHIAQLTRSSLFEVSEALIERVRNMAHAFSLLVRSAINRHPPLQIKVCEINGTIHQVAHAFYGDYRRADELLRLNPHIRLPNFIQQGDLLNAYSK